MKELYKTIEEKINSSEKENLFSVFDFDNTCIVNDIAEATLAYMARNNLFKCRNVLPGLENLNLQILSEKIFKYYYGLLSAGDVKGAYEFGAKTLEGLSISETENLVMNVLKFEDSEIIADKLFDVEIVNGIAVRKSVMKLIKYLQVRKVIVWVVSASPEILVAETLKNFNINVHLIGIKNVVKDNIITADLKYPTPTVEGKVDCIKLFIDSVVKPILGVGDNNNDLPMLEYADIKVVVDRHNPLSKKAKNEGWFLLD